MQNEALTQGRMSDNNPGCAEVAESTRACPLSLRAYHAKVKDFEQGKRNMHLLIEYPLSQINSVKDLKVVFL